MILIVASTKDVASMNIRQQLLVHYDFKESEEKFHSNPVYHKTLSDNEVKLVTIDEEAIYYQSILNHFNPQLIIYISRHSSKSGTPTLSVHTPGNLTAQAQKGGLPNRISIAPANAMKEALLEMAEQKNTHSLDYQVSYECTHHGPSLNIATMFVELGSSPTQWKDMKAAEAVAHAAMAPILRKSRNSIVAVGIGGPHYSQKFTRMALEDDFAFGHIIPKYAISHVDAKTIRQCVERTLEKVETVTLDWKGIKGADKTKLVKASEEAGVQTQKV
ncbi:D-tyrosyl-tRNA(Tyr) deacylase [Candidatus Bathyarchaeota archaeon]|nr:D-tyrosyl-tRNA(Tyr) deacylase [Candidatus Bathyarchaeota archaeon]